MSRLTGYLGLRNARSPLSRTATWHDMTKAEKNDGLGVWPVWFGSSVLAAVVASTIFAYIQGAAPFGPNHPDAAPRVAEKTDSTSPAGGPATPIDNARDRQARRVPHSPPAKRSRDYGWAKTRLEGWGCAEIALDGPLITATCPGGEGRRVRSDMDLRQCASGNLALRDGLLACYIGDLRANNGDDAIRTRLQPARCTVVRFTGSVVTTMCPIDDRHDVLSELDRARCLGGEVTVVGGSLVCAQIP